MTSRTLDQALAYARLGWPVFPCHPGEKAPVTGHGHLDATTSTRQITSWFGRHPDWNVAVATGAPGPDVLDVDQRGQAGNGFRALARLRAAGLLEGAFAYVRTPGGGQHVYFTGSAQRSGHLPAQHVDFLSGGGYVIAPPSQIQGRPYRFTSVAGGHGQLDWQAAAGLLQPARQQQPAPRPPARPGISHLAEWVASQPEGNRNAGLFWAASRALEADPAADLSPLAAAARQAGLGEPEITRTLGSAHRTGQAQHPTPGPQAEAEGEAR